MDACWTRRNRSDPPIRTNLVTSFSVMVRRVVAAEFHELKRREFVLDLWFCAALKVMRCARNGISTS